MGLAKNWRGEELPYAHLKRDGICLEISRSRAGLIRCWTTTPHDIYHKLKHCTWLARAATFQPPGTTVLGELSVRNRAASYVSSAIASRSSELRFEAFAISQGFDPDAELWDTNNQLKDWGYYVIPYFLHQYADVPARNESRFESCASLVKRPLPPDCEGYVFKSSNMGKFQKWKPVLTLDLKVVGIKEGKGKYDGQVGALVVATKEGHIVAAVSGMSDEQRLVMDEGDIGRIAEIRYQYVGEQGRLRHPAFVRWREDKSEANDITADRQLEEHYR